MTDVSQVAAPRLGRLSRNGSSRPEPAPLIRYGGQGGEPRCPGRQDCTCGRGRAVFDCDGGG